MGLLLNFLILICRSLQQNVRISTPPRELQIWYFLDLIHQPTFLIQVSLSQHSWWLYDEKYHNSRHSTAHANTKAQGRAAFRGSNKYFHHLACVIIWCHHNGNAVLPPNEYNASRYCHCCYLARAVSDPDFAVYSNCWYCKTSQCPWSNLCILVSDWLFQSNYMIEALTIYTFIEVRHPNPFFMMAIDLKIEVHGWTRWRHGSCCAFGNNDEISFVSH